MCITQEDVSKASDKLLRMGQEERRSMADFIVHEIGIYLNSVSLGMVQAESIARKRLISKLVTMAIKEENK